MSPSDTSLNTTASAPTALGIVISENENNPESLRRYCETSRCNRNARFKEKMLDAKFPGIQRDEILISLMTEPGYVDVRNNLCIRARPTAAVKRLIKEIQQELTVLAPRIWRTPPEFLHMTVLELLYAQPPDIIEGRILQLEPFVGELTDFAFHRRTRLVRPKLSFDDVAVALSFVPAAGGGGTVGDEYTYLHLRRDLEYLCLRHGVEVEARYATTSSHCTIARFVDERDFGVDGEDGVVPDPEKMRRWVEKLEEWNAKLEREYWMEEEGGRGLEWYVGAEQGLEIQKGRLWYGGGETHIVGKGY